MDNKNKYNYILIGVLILLALGLFLIVRKSDEKEKAIKEEAIKAKEKYTVVDQKSIFFTVESCANRYIISLSNKDVNSLMKLVDQSIINSHNLDKSNIIDYLGKLDDSYSFEARRIFVKKDGNISKYFVYGLLKKELIDEYDKGTDYYLIINIDNKKSLFSVEPYDGSYFKEENNGRS